MGLAYLRPHWGGGLESMGRLPIPVPWSGPSWCFLLPTRFLRIRVLEIEKPWLGREHEDVQVLQRAVRQQLSESGLSEDAVAAFEARLSDPDLPQDSHALGSTCTGASQVPSLAVSSAAALGSAVVGGTLTAGVSAMSSTCSVLGGVGTSLVSMAARHSTRALLGATAAPDSLVAATSTAVGYASAGALNLVQGAAGVALNAASSASVSLVASATGAAISFTGHRALDFFGTREAACADGEEEQKEICDSDKCFTFLLHSSST